MTCKEYLDLQQQQALRGLSRATRATGTAVEQAVDLEGHVRQHPVLSLGLSAAAGFAAARLAFANSHRVTRGMARTVWSPLIRPTLVALGGIVAEMLVGSPAPPQE